jgi:hypothetical protein
LKQENGAPDERNRAPKQRTWVLRKLAKPWLYFTETCLFSAQNTLPFVCLSLAHCSKAPLSAFFQVWLFQDVGTPGRRRLRGPVLAVPRSGRRVPSSGFAGVWGAAAAPASRTGSLPTGRGARPAGGFEKYCAQSRTPGAWWGEWCRVQGHKSSPSCAMSFA